MRRVAILMGSCLALAIMLLTPGGASAALTQCPPVAHDTSCQFLITVTDKGVQVAQDPAQGPYDGEDDALIGVQNSSSKPIASIPLSAENDLFGFEFDGICHPGIAPNAPGCVVPPKDSSGNATENPGTPCTAESSSTCAFPSPAGEPAGVTFTGGIVGFGASGDALTGYEGPGSYFTNIAPTGNSGLVNFSPPLAPGASSYFGLESPPTGKTITVGSPTTLTTLLSGGGQSGTTVTVAQGTPVTDSATVAGAAAATSTGEVTYAIYKDPACAKLATQAGGAAVTNGAGGPSAPQSKLAPGTYYWLATYSGDINNQASASICGSEKLIVAHRASLGLPPGKKCVSKRHFTVHPRAPHHIRLVHVEVLINGKLVKSGSLSRRHTSVDLRGLPKGTFHVLLITQSATGKTYADGRTFHTCVPKRHKRH